MQVGGRRQEKHRPRIRDPKRRCWAASQNACSRTMGQRRLCLPNIALLVAALWATATIAGGRVSHQLTATSTSSSWKPDSTQDFYTVSDLPHKVSLPVARSEQSSDTHHLYEGLDSSTKSPTAFESETNDQSSQTFGRSDKYFQNLRDLYIKNFVRPSRLIKYTQTEDKPVGSKKFLRPLIRNDKVVGSEDDVNHRDKNSAHVLKKRTLPFFLELESVQIPVTNGLKEIENGGKSTVVNHYQEMNDHNSDVQGSPLIRLSKLKMTQKLASSIRKNALNKLNSLFLDNHVYRWKQRRLRLNLNPHQPNVRPLDHIQDILSDSPIFSQGQAVKDTNTVLTLVVPTSHLHLLLQSPDETHPETEVSSSSPLLSATELSGLEIADLTILETESENSTLALTVQSSADSNLEEGMESPRFQTLSRSRRSQIRNIGVNERFRSQVAHRLSISYKHVQPCAYEDRHFCMNGGTCVFVGALDIKTCRCPITFTGVRCELLDHEYILSVLTNSLLS